MELLMRKYNVFLKNNEDNYFSIIAMVILVGSIWGGLAAMLIDRNNSAVWQLALNVSSSMAGNVVAIGQAPLKWVINLFILGIIINTILIVINII
ncbi:MAG: hypothetical protein ACK5D5_11560 [Bacteroidota bacterium]|jgi:hypothetical protein